ncbi:MAG TPA: PQQ-dependent sugar dehydrogenase, partial [Halioglobus sp.]
LDKVTYNGIPGMPTVDGGAIERFKDGFVAVTGDGQFYELSWSASDGNLAATKLPLSSPLVGRDAFFVNQSNTGLQFRVTDLLIRQSGQDYQVFVAHQVWDQANDCFLLGLSRSTLPKTIDSGAKPVGAWTKIYETHPCIKQPFDTVETGGRLAWLGSEAILMTVGDHGSDGRAEPPLSQMPDADYGKVLVIDLQGGARVLTSGHRNPQGLFVDNVGQTWLTEHGPAGGDEINRLVEGQNYGWPSVTYGTDYYKLTWPLNPDARDHANFTEPTFAFVPSIAISNLIQLGGRQFPRWEDDFLVGSLRMETLYRLRMRENRVLFVEPILLGNRIRDLVEASDGRIIVWSDDESVSVLSRHIGPSSGEDIFQQCRACHAPVGNAKAIAPDLRGIVQRKVASSPDFSYSPALQAVGGTWTEERLLEFLKNPQKFAPGTAMISNGVSDEADRAALIDYLKRYGTESR